MFKQHIITQHGATNEATDCSKYSANETGKKVLATFTLLVTMNCGFG